MTGAPVVRVLNAELEPLILSKAAQFGLAPAWVSRLAKADPERRQVGAVCRHRRVASLGAQPGRNVSRGNVDLGYVAA